MYYLVYLIRNLVNNKIYVGVHSAWNLDDGYLDSGQNIKRAIKKYGKENFERTILHYCYDEIQMYEWEKQIVDKNFIMHDNTYNLCVGGYKPPSRKNSIASRETKIKMSEASKGKPSNFKNHFHTNKTKTQMSNVKIGKSSNHKDSLHSGETKIQMSIAHLNLPIITCSYCNKTGKGGAMYRWHFKKCKLYFYPK